MVTAVICEYNPFHKGHKYQLDEIRRLQPSAKILSIMSPNFVQRGQPAVFDKYVRGECAVRCGADIAVSMPQVFSLLSAEGFAECGVKLAKKSGATTLSFGVEDDNIEKLKNVAEILVSDEFEKEFKRQLAISPNLSFPHVRQMALECFTDKETATIITTPNNILGVEYIKAIIRFCPDMNILPIKRIGNSYNDTSDVGEMLSATAIRKMMINSKEWTSAVPLETRNVVGDSLSIDFCRYEDMLFSVLSVSEYSKIFHSVGNKELTDTIVSAIAESGDYTSFRQKLSRKKFTETKIDRILVNFLLGIGYDEYMHSDPEYMTVLAMNGIGRSILKNADIPVISRYVDGKHFDGDQISKELLADKIWARCSAVPVGEKYFINKKPFIVEDIK